MAINVPKEYEVPLYLFHQGKNAEAYKLFGSHFAKKDGVSGVVFRVWAPKAADVSVVGDFNHWNREESYMKKISDGGIWELFIPGLKKFDNYKYSIKTERGQIKLKADPYGYHMETRPNTASKVYDISGYNWKDSKWMGEKKTKDVYRSPMNIYEVHLNSWFTKTDEEELFSYMQLAEKLVPYVKEMGYTHIEMMPIAEFPFDGSWGYQVTGYYAPTSRYGSPEDFAYLVDLLHKNNIGVILDWVPAHFPKDAHGLADFDGTPTFEYADPRLGEHPDWGTKVFDYGKQDGQWVANKYGGNENLEAIDFFKHLNSVVLGRNKGAVMIAEESTAWPKVTGSPEDDGLGFSLKWNMGWMHDFTEYMKLDPYFRKNAHHMMTFAMQYAYSENYILVLSHDEVVHLKCSMINKMPGLGFDKFANLKAGYAFMMGHPGKKLLFMGQEFAQLREWSEKREIDWFLLAEPEHRDIQNWYRDLLHLYKNNKALYEMDNDPAGFEWINADDIFRSIYSFVRHSKNKEKNLLFVCNFTPVEREDYRVGVPTRKTLKLVLNSDEEKYGGKGEKRPLTYKPVKKECDGQAYSIAYPLPAYGVAVFEY